MDGDIDLVRKSEKRRWRSKLAGPEDELGRNTCMSGMLHDKHAEGAGRVEFQG